MDKKKVIFTVNKTEEDYNFMKDFRELLNEPSSEEIQRFQNDLAKE